MRNLETVLFILDLLFRVALLVTLLSHPPHMELLAIA